MLNKDLDSLLKVNNELRIAANLPPLSDDEQLLGTGGGEFVQPFNFISSGDIDVTRALEFVDAVNKKVDFEKNQFTLISEKLKSNEKLYESLPALKPCEGTLSDHGFGLRRHPILNIVRMHEGVDIITDRGTNVYAPGGGKIESVGYRGGYGLCIEIDHGFGYRTVYAHLSSSNVQQGQTIKRGDLIARSGNSGLSSGPHLHYEVIHNGIKQNPRNFFFDDLNLAEFKSQISNTGVR
ncbi:MAG: M23 family metallopeptidase [Ignavibacteriales bacterium]|nr:MAG: M23 family metallopeptidase [Ignavibacteriales bacterium]